MASPIIPFGKYKGQPAEVLLQDSSYIEWLRNQDWFAAKYQTLNVFITNHGEQQDTPEHNALQALFLNRKFRRAFAIRLGFKPTPDASGLAIDQAEAFAASVGGTVQRGESPFTTKLIGFEHDGCDVYFRATRHGVSVAYGTDCYKNRGFLEEFTREFYVEIKPSLGDDYPAVLRQIMATKWYRQNGTYGDGVLFYDKFAAVGATEEQVKEIFGISRIEVVTTRDLIEASGK